AAETHCQRKYQPSRGIKTATLNLQTVESEARENINPVAGLKHRICQPQWGAGGVACQRKYQPSRGIKTLKAPIERPAPSEAGKNINPVAGLKQPT
ncbi:MAG: hypothetical protein ACOYNY_17335, partial [Caldilineaceae bacterium]